jgi:hypothetical protein
VLVGSNSALAGIYDLGRYLSKLLASARAIAIQNPEFICHPASLLYLSFNL